MMLDDFHKAVRKNDMSSSSKQLILCLPIKVWMVEIGECEVMERRTGVSHLEAGPWKDRPRELCPY
jgi:hypothetical protein